VIGQLKNLGFYRDNIEGNSLKAISSFIFLGRSYSQIIQGCLSRLN